MVANTEATYSNICARQEARKSNIKFFTPQIYYGTAECMNRSNGNRIFYPNLKKCREEKYREEKCREEKPPENKIAKENANQENSESTEENFYQDSKYEEAQDFEDENHSENINQEYYHPRR